MVEMKVTVTQKKYEEWQYSPYINNSTHNGAPANSDPRITKARVLEHTLWRLPRNSMLIFFLTWLTESELIPPFTQMDSLQGEISLELKQTKINKKTVRP